VSISRSRVYLLGADGVVLALTPDGRIVRITRLPYGRGLRAAFAVSPEDRRIAGGRPMGWIDAGHLVVAAATVNEPSYRVLDVSSRRQAVVALPREDLTFYGTL